MTRWGPPFSPPSTAMLPQPPPTKENAPCCRARRDHRGRLPVGFCSPECIRRPKNWEAIR